MFTVELITGRGWDALALEEKNIQVTNLLEAEKFARSWLQEARKKSSISPPTGYRILDESGNRLRRNQWRISKVAKIAAILGLLSTFFTIWNSQQDIHKWIWLYQHGHWGLAFMFSATSISGSYIGAFLAIFLPFTLICAVRNLFVMRHLPRFKRNA